MQTHHFRGFSSPSSIDTIHQLCICPEPAAAAWTENGFSKIQRNLLFDSFHSKQLGKVLPVSVHVEEVAGLVDGLGAGVGEEDGGGVVAVEAGAAEELGEVGQRGEDGELVRGAAAVPAHQREVGRGAGGGVARGAQELAHKLLTLVHLQLWWPPAGCMQLFAVGSTEMKDCGFKTRLFDSSSKQLQNNKN